jgi:hypothetical protein
MFIDGKYRLLHPGWRADENDARNNRTASLFLKKALFPVMIA